MFGLVLSTPFAGSLQNLIPGTPVIGMNALQHHLQRRLDRSIVFNNSIGFLGPLDFPAPVIPAEATGRAQALPFGEKCLAALQVGVEPGVLERNRSLRGQ